MPSKETFPMPINSLQAFVFSSASTTPRSDVFQLYKGNIPFESAETPKALASLISDIRCKVDFLTQEQMKKNFTFYERCRPFSDDERNEFTKNR